MPNYFTMKMRGGTETPDDRQKVIDFVKETNCIGIGEPEYTTGAGTFRNNIQIGDIVVLRAGGRPLVLVKVISDAYQYKPEGKFPDFDNWLDCVRKVKIISWYDDLSYIHFDARGYLQDCAAIRMQKTNWGFPIGSFRKTNYEKTQA